MKFEDIKKETESMNWSTGEKTRFLEGAKFAGQRTAKEVFTFLEGRFGNPICKEMLDELRSIVYM